MGEKAGGGKDGRKRGRRGRGSVIFLSGHMLESLRCIFII
jgi:hypothetical protein